MILTKYNGIWQWTNDKNEQNMGVYDNFDF